MLSSVYMLLIIVTVYLSICTNPCCENGARFLVTLRDLQGHSDLSNATQYFVCSRGGGTFAALMRHQFCHSSHDLIHCKMQGAPWRLTGKPRMSCVRQFCPLFTRIVYTAVQPLSNCGRKFSETPGFFRIQILQNSISAGAPPQSPLGELTMLPQTP